MAGVDLQGFVERGPSLDWWSVLAACANVALLLGDAETATVVGRALAPYDGRNLVGGQIAFYGAVSHALGVAAVVVGDEEAAVRHLEAAVKRHQQMGAAPVVALSSAELARLPAVARDPDRLEGLTAAAASTADRLGLAHVARRLPQGTGRRPSG
jgi:hypothetical protein